MSLIPSHQTTPGGRLYWGQIVARGAAFPLARQVTQVTRYEQRRTRTPGRWYWKKIEVAYYLCTWDQIRLPAAQLARAVKTTGWSKSGTRCET
jgi:hypothetical protein